MMDYDDAIEYILRFAEETTHVDLHEYMANTFVLDEIILNEDRHFNNLALIYDGSIFRPAPIFDNGKSLLVGNKKGKAYAKAFSGDFELNRKYLQRYATLEIDASKVMKYIEKHSDEISERAVSILRKRFGND